MDFTSRQLRAFLLVAQHRSFTRAAERRLTYTSNLKGEIDSASDHPEVVPWAFYHAEAEIIDPADVAGDAGFESGPKLPDQFRLAAVMDRESIGDQSIGFIGGRNALKPGGSRDVLV